ncbi:hypothetical protein T492DRAFT_1094649 [Pavlovales sp. CCMP2436]|nr:hypothetical protein T492DRAFT_1094649 [Pavlovales sp. CCMP2436]|mmetsp:Transcript_245/g.668  ORF Transcript_245/g.668 Transcript_245/m.668 type:complete len:198 (-) Transcript_245:261-854(-)
MAAPGGHSYAGRFQYRAVDEEMMRAIGEAFRAYDGEGRGALTRHGLKCAMTALMGMPPAPLELNAILPKRGSADEPEPTLDADAFAQAMCERLCAVDETDVIRQTFRAFDTAYKGYVTYVDFAHAFALSAPHIPAETLRLVFDEVDTDRNGKVSWAEFERMMKFRPHASLRPPVAGVSSYGQPRSATTAAAMWWGAY